ncbi:carbohydrate-binding family 9-like protein [Ruminococcaceae bacterium OttesenSCG-928-L11]|nr:carbohydrate-binding family 9-like protein [Ruminococcaceae bacterium OttesenSCG-928-L11]
MATTILRCDTVPEWDRVPVLPVAHYSWGGDYRPETTAQMVWIPERGFLVRMTTKEVNPLPVYMSGTDPVHEDSCMECFINVAPDTPGTGYLNFETNANGALHCKYGTGRGAGRKPLSEFGAVLPAVTIEKTADSWSCQYWIDNELIQAVYGIPAMKTGDKIRANFYKCGDKTEFPHYGSWMPIDTPQPDFHRPEFFGELIVG